MSAPLTKFRTQAFDPHQMPSYSLIYSINGVIYYDNVNVPTLKSTEVVGACRELVGSLSGACRELLQSEVLVWGDSQL